jgi:hypothetical protein
MDQVNFRFHTSHISVPDEEYDEYKVLKWIEYDSDANSTICEAYEVYLKDPSQKVSSSDEHKDKVDSLNPSRFTR